MSAKRRLRTIEQQLTPTQLSRLWLERVRRFAGPAEYVDWFFGASSAARRAFLLQAGPLMRRRHRGSATTPSQSGGNDGRIAVLREICFEWFTFSKANRFFGALSEVVRDICLTVTIEWCWFVEVWSAAANANLDQANAWLKREEVRAAVVGSLLGQERHGVESPLMVGRLADAGVGQDQSWPHRPPWLDAKPEFAPIAETMARILQRHASFLKKKK